MRYNITNNNLPQIFLNIEKELEENKETINELLKIDCKYCKIKINLGMMKKTIDLLRNEQIDIQKQRKIIVKYNGNPCLTLNLCILAIITKNIIVLDYQNNMKGINSFIVQTVNNLLKRYNTDKLIYQEKYNENNVDKIICIDDINQYNIYLQEKNAKAKFYSFNYIDFYSDCDEYEELEELIYKFAEENQIPIEIYSELDLEEAVQMIKNGLGRNVIVLTKSNNTKNKFEENIENKKLYINKNPFKENIGTLDRKILNI